MPPKKKAGVPEFDRAGSWSPDCGGVRAVYEGCHPAIQHDWKLPRWQSIISHTSCRPDTGKKHPATTKEARRETPKRNTTLKAQRVTVESPVKLLTVARPELTNMPPKKKAGVPEFDRAGSWSPDCGGVRAVYEGCHPAIQHDWKLPRWQSIISHTSCRPDTGKKHPATTKEARRETPKRNTTLKAQRVTVESPVSRNSPPTAGPSRHAHHPERRHADQRPPTATSSRTALNPAPIPVQPPANPHAPNTIAEFLQNVMHLDLSHHLPLLTERGFTDMALLRTMATHWEDEDLRGMLRGC
ncbi:hypothetical protein C8R46DRAFT_1040956 [Mycena filopes]|nr:hypothetical protein C8R46DRAFT_1040956 [Mycena filopes]